MTEVEKNETMNRLIAGGGRPGAELRRMTAACRATFSRQLTMKGCDLRFAGYRAEQSQAVGSLCR